MPSIRSRARASTSGSRMRACSPRRWARRSALERPGDLRVLRRYARGRREDVTAMQHFTDRLDALFASDAPLVGELGIPGSPWSNRSRGSAASSATGRCDNGDPFRRTAMALHSEPPRVLALALALPALAQEDRVRAALKKVLPEAPIHTIRKTSYGGLYEVTIGADVTSRLRNSRLTTLFGVRLPRRFRAAAATRFGIAIDVTPPRATASPAPAHAGRAAPARRRACRWSRAWSPGAAAGHACRPCRSRCRTGWRRLPAPPAARRRGSRLDQPPPGGVDLRAATCAACSRDLGTVQSARRTPPSASSGPGGSISSNSPFAIVPSVPVTQLPKVSSTICFPTVVAPALPPAPVATTG